MNTLVHNHRTIHIIQFAHDSGSCKDRVGFSYCMLSRMTFHVNDFMPLVMCFCDLAVP